MKKGLMALCLGSALLWADPFLPGAVGRTKTAFPLSGRGIVVDLMRVNYGIGSWQDRGFQATNMFTGAEFQLVSWFSVFVAQPFYWDRVQNTAFGRGDLIAGAGLRWKPWPDKNIYMGITPLITVPTGSDGYSADSLRRFSTQGLDWAVLAMGSWALDEKNLLAGNAGFYNPNQANEYGSHTDQIVYRLLWIRQFSKNLWLGSQCSGEWFFVNRIVPEVSYMAGGSPARLNLVGRAFLGPVFLELSPGVYMTKRQVLRGDSLVYPQPLYTLPVGNLWWEVSGGLGLSPAKGLIPRSGNENPVGPGGFIKGVALFPDSVPAVVNAEIAQLGLNVSSDSSGTFFMGPVPPDTYTVYISGSGVAAVDPLQVAVMEGETTALNLTVNRAGAAEVTVTLRDIVTKKTIQGMVIVEGLDNVIAFPKSFCAKNACVCVLSPGAYVLTAKADGYFSSSTPLSLNSDEKVDVILELIPKDFTMEFPGVMFEFGSAKLKPEAYPVLDSIASTIRTIFASNDRIKIEVGGYTDNVGSFDYNLALSEKRARAVADFLVENYGLNPDRVLFKGYGSRRPKAPNTTEQGRAANRRVEIKLLEVI